MRIRILTFINIASVYLLGFSLYYLYTFHYKRFQNSLIHFYCSYHEMPNSKAIMNNIGNKISEKYPQLKVLETQGDWVFVSRDLVDCFEEFRLYVDGFEQPISYQGAWYTSDIFDWVDRTMKAFSFEAKTIEEIEEIVDNNEVVALFLANNDLSVYPNIINAANTAPNYDTSYTAGDDTIFIYSKDSKVKEFYQAKRDTLILFDKLNQTQQVHEGPFHTEGVVKFMSSINPMTRVSRFNWNRYSALLYAPLSTIFLVRNNDEAGYQAEKVFREAVKSLRGKIQLYIFDIVPQDRYYKTELTATFPFSADDIPAIRIIKPGQTMLKYAYQGNLTADGIRIFADKFLVGNLTPYLISDPLPVNEYENNVRVVVAQTFEKIVLDQQKDVLLVVPGYKYASDPIYLNFLGLLAEKFKDVEDFVFAKIDILTNEIDGIKTSVYGGQLRLYPKNLKHSPIIESFNDYPYKAERDINYYIQFLKRYAFIVINTQSKLSSSEPRVFDIFSWAEQEPHPICPSKRKWKTREEELDQPNILDMALSVNEDNFSEIVFDDENDVFLVAYTPGDDITAFLQFARRLMDVKNLKFAKIDSSVNEVAGVKECSTPVYRLYPRNTKNAPIICSHTREEWNFLLFLRRRGTVSIPFIPELEKRYDY